jgi:DNA invertase Pin-like site-specific DNA recombinase
VAGVLASLAELELELGKERRTAVRDARRARGQSIGRPKALTDERVALARRMHDSGESATTIATTLRRRRRTAPGARSQESQPVKGDDDRRAFVSRYAERQRQMSEQVPQD